MIPSLGTATILLIVAVVVAAAAAAAAPASSSRLPITKERNGTTTASAAVAAAKADEACRAYVMRFLDNETITTDNKRDKCTAFHNAYVFSGDCDAQHYDPAKNDDDTFYVDRSISGPPMVTQECCRNMERYYLRYCSSFGEEESSNKVGGILLGIIGVLLACVIAKAILVDYFQLKWLPDACVYIVVGATISSISVLFLPTTMVYNHFYFDEDFFLQILLPPTIFQAALSIDKPSFGKHLPPILLFAVVGTTISAFSIGYMTNFLTNGYIPLLESLVFGALISSIDPVATLGILTNVGVDPTSTLYALIFGESLLNDGVAIVLFDTIQSHLGRKQDDSESILDDPTFYVSLLQDFIIILMGSILSAIVLGIFASLFFFWLQKISSPMLPAVAEVATFFAWALVPYYVAEAMEFSGIIAILTMGFIMDYFILGGGGEGGVEEETAGSHNNKRSSSTNNNDDITWKEIMAGRGLLSSKCCIHIEFMAHAIASTMDTIIFAYLGLFVFDDKVYSMELEQVAIWTCIISRAFMVILLSWLVNFSIASCGKSSTDTTVGDNNQPTSSSSSSLLLDRKTQTMLFLAGIRGAVSFALVSKLPVYDIVTQHGTQFKAEIKAMTSTAIICTLFVFGPLAYFVVVTSGCGSPSSSSSSSESAADTDTDGGATDPLLSSGKKGKSIPTSTVDYGATTTTSTTTTTKTAIPSNKSLVV